MRGLGAVTLITGGVLGAADTVQVPTWAMLLVTLITSGVYLRIYTVRMEKRLTVASTTKTHAESEEIYQRIAQHTGRELETLQAKYAQLEAQYDALQAEHARSEAVHDRERHALRTELRALEEELATTRAQAGLTERRKNP